MTWTFDPMIARNAYFNLRKLGCVARAFHRDYYGSMTDDFNRGERSDRLEVRWELDSSRVRAAIENSPEKVDAADAPALLTTDGVEGKRDASSRAVSIYIPRDYLALRNSGGSDAVSLRDRVADALEWAFMNDYIATDFSRDGAYVLTRDP
jgi:predicted GNAT superfamily acetyltransferase